MGLENQDISFELCRSQLRPGHLHTDTYPFATKFSIFLNNTRLFYALLLLLLIFFFLPLSLFQGLKLDTDNLKEHEQ